MLSNTIALRYAACLYQASTKQAIQKNVYKDLISLLDLLEQVPALLVFLKNPVPKRTQKQQVLQRLFKDRMQTQTLTFLLFVIEKRRYTLLVPIVKAFITQYKNTQKIQIVHLTTAQPLAADIQEQLDTFIVKHAATTNVELIKHINKSLISGFILHINDTQIDTSIRTKLQQLKHFWLQPKKNNSLQQDKVA